VSHLICYNSESKKLVILKSKRSNFAHYPKKTRQEIKININQRNDVKILVISFTLLFLIFYSNVSAEAIVLTIDSISFPCAVEVNSNLSKAYVTSRTSGVLVLDTITNDIVGNYTVGENPCELAVNEESNLVYVLNEGSNTVDVIDGETNEIVSSFELMNPYDIAINPNTNMIYITSDADGLVYVVDGDTNEIQATLDVPKPCGISLNPETNIIYVSSESTNSVRVIDGFSNQFIANVTVGEKPRGVAVNPNTNLIYITNTASGSLTVLDGHTNKVKTLVDVGRIPWRVDVDTFRNMVYVANAESQTISVIDADNHIQVKTIRVKNPFDISFDSSTNKIFITSMSTFSIIEQSKPSSPRDQFLQGIVTEDIVCKEGLELVFKSTNNHPACVKPSSVEKLIERGWASILT